MWNTDTKGYLSAWADKYRSILLDNILPFWLRCGYDREYGGVMTCLDREGNVMDETKSVWFQGRCAWVYAFAYNNIKRDPAFLEFSRSCLDFIEKYCFDPQDGRMYFEVTRDGRPLRKRRYVFSECFAAIAMAEYSLATGERIWAEKALHLFKDMQRFINTPGILEPKYLPTQPAQGHSVTMILINTASRIREVISDPALDEQIDRSLSAIRDYFMHPEYKALLETVGPDGELIDTLAGRTINPGHCIETSWFLLEESRHRGWDPAIRDMALQILDWSWKWGWDNEYGGIINFRDCKGFPSQDYSQDMKFWWPQTEAVIATLYAYEATADARYLEMHRLANDWMMEYLPDPVYGEWFGYLHRDGSVAQSAKGNIFKGPFHIPRMLVKSTMLIGEILKSMPTD